MDAAGGCYMDAVNHCCMDALRGCMDAERNCCSKSCCGCSKGLLYGYETDVCKSASAAHSARRLPLGLPLLHAEFSGGRVNGVRVCVFVCSYMCARRPE